MRCTLWFPVLAVLLSGCAHPPVVEAPRNPPVDPTTSASFRSVPRSPDVAAYPTEREHVWALPTLGRSFVTVRVVNYPKPRLPVVAALPHALQVPVAAAPAPISPPPVWETTVYFQTGKSALDGKARSDLDSLFSSIGSFDSVATVTVDGYTDSVGSDASNHRLSQDRAASVKAYVVSKGIPQLVISSAAHGERSPSASNSTSAGRAANRRSTLQIEGKGRP